MNFISLLLSYEFYIICIISQKIIKIENYSELDQLYFLENERHHLEKGVLAIPFKNEEDLQRKLLNSSSYKLIEKQNEIGLSLDGNAILFKFLSHQGLYINICFLQHQSIDCKIRINNTLYNEGIIINEITSNQIHLPSNSCNKAFYIEEDSFLIHCMNSNKQFQYFILNEQSQILDEITVDQPQNCELDSKFQPNKLFIYSLDCQISIILIIEINLKEGKLQFDKNFTRLHELDNYPNQSNLIDLKLCEKDVVLMIFPFYMCTYNIENQRFKIENGSYQPWFAYIQDSCIPYIMKGQFSAQNRQEQYFSLFNSKINRESQIKSIQYFDKIFLFLFDGQIVITYDNSYEETIFNIKQIYILNPLPYLVTLDQNNKISFYKFVCLNNFIQYQDLPFIGIQYKNQLKLYTNQIVYYHQVLKYSLNYPLKIQLTESVQILQQLRNKNTFIIDPNQLSQAIPIYIDLEFDKDHIFQEYKNEMIVTHQLKLPIKKILKIISYEINFIAIIYEDVHHKIFVNLKYNDIQKNIYIMSTLFEMSVEFIKQDINQIALFLISKYQITQFIIVDRNDLIYQNSIKPKSVIQEYKKQLFRIIFLLDDNTILAYGYNNWYDFFSMKSLEETEFWMKKTKNYNDFRVPYLYIDHQNCSIEIKPLIPNKNNILVTTNGQILISHIFVHQSRILLIVKNDNLIQLKLYYFGLNEILLLYQMPTFEFHIVQPIKIKFCQNLFSIITTKNEQEYLFTYDVTQQGKSCLRQITKMQINYQNFDLIDETGVTSQVLTDKIVINYSYFNISIKQTKISDYAKIDYEITFQAKSFIQSIPSNFIIQIHQQNFDNNLRYKLNSKQQILMINNQNEISNLDSIYGSIDNIQLSNNCKGYLNRPIQSIQSIQLNHCSSIYKQFCLMSESILIIDYFSSNITINLQKDKILLNPILKSNHNVIIINNIFKQSIGIFSLEGKKSILQNLNNDSYYVKLEDINFNSINLSISFINDFLIIKAFSVYSIYQIMEDQNNLNYQIVCTLDFISVKQIEFLFKHKSSYLLLTLNSYQELYFQICPDPHNQFKENLQFILDIQIVAFHVLNFKYDKLKIDLILILFCYTDLAYIYECSFDLQQLKITKQLMRSQIIRYINISYVDFMNISDTNFILKGNNENQIPSLYLYNINLSSSIEVIDYYYKDEEFSNIEYYNETHFVQILDFEKDSKIVQLIEIHNYYQLHLQNNCELVLHNDVSSLRSPIILENTNQDKFTITLYLLIGNFLLILLFSNKNKKIIIKNRRI